MRKKRVLGAFHWRTWHRDNCEGRGMDGDAVLNGRWLSHCMGVWQSRQGRSGAGLAGDEGVVGLGGGQGQGEAGASAQRDMGDGGVTCDLWP